MPINSFPPQAAPQSQRTVDVQILGLNETHGQLIPLKRNGRLTGGAPTLAAYLKQEEAENSRTLILDTRTAEAVNAAVEELRARNVETIVVSAHPGLETETSGALADLVAQLSGEVDLVLGGHIPLEFNTTINGIPVVRPYGNTRGYADVTLTVDRATKDVVGTAVELDPIWVDAIAPDPAVKAIVDGYQAQLGEELGKTVGRQ